MPVSMHPTCVLLHCCMEACVYGCLEYCDPADIVRYHVSIANVETLSRFCGALSKKIFPSVSQYEIWSVGSVHEVDCLFLLKEMDSVLKALMQAWEKAQQLKITLV